MSGYCHKHSQRYEEACALCGLERGPKPKPTNQARFRTTVERVSKAHVLEQKRDEVACYEERLAEAKHKLKQAKQEERLAEAKHKLKQAKQALRETRRGPSVLTATRYLPVYPGEEGYEDLPITFCPENYQGEVRWKGLDSA